MSPETIIIILALIAIALGALWYMQSRKSGDTPTPAPVTYPSGAKAGPLTAADYAATFFGGTLNGNVVYAYKLPSGVRGYGPGGVYDKDRFDPRAFDAATERIIGPDGTYVDVRTLTRHLTDGSVVSIEPMTMRQWLYGLTIDPASVPKGDLLAQGIVTAPRAYLWEHAYTGPGAFGGGA